MGKMFEDYFSEIQADMVSICLEYVEKRAEKIYIYCSFEDGMISSGFFYKVNSMVLCQDLVQVKMRNFSPF